MTDLQCCIYTKVGYNVKLYVADWSCSLPCGVQWIFITACTSKTNKKGSRHHRQFASLVGSHKAVI